jgi:hypothetical protein
LYVGPPKGAHAEMAELGDAADSKSLHTSFTNF